eukprot:CAMPEP_0174978646 /NCGR_PEP_ID=MMETSP0004_2-20121128/14325_1 /TAXON_ID=420556 /ORGANISM="Ochromonas sp., Strain CCMP1393" /LENGTH=286 /DNA_ID=CAMNT_0016230053 /DNA_START=994 /DNA_END=1851 /DNA_ORIENTATION=-
MHMGLTNDPAVRRRAELYARFVARKGAHPEDDDIFDELTELARYRKDVQEFENKPNSINEEEEEEDVDVQKGSLDVDKEQHRSMLRMDGGEPESGPDLGAVYADKSVVEMHLSNYMSGRKDPATVLHGSKSPPVAAENISSPHHKPSDITTANNNNNKNNNNNNNHHHTTAAAAKSKNSFASYSLRELFCGKTGLVYQSLQNLSKSDLAVAPLRTEDLETVYQCLIDAGCLTTGDLVAYLRAHRITSTTSRSEGELVGDASDAIYAHSDISSSSSSDNSSRSIGAW